MLEQKQAGLPLEIVKSSPQFHSVTARGANGKEATFSWAQRDAVLNLIEATKSGLPISSHELAYTLHQKVDDFSLYTTHNVLGTVNKRLAKLGTEIVGDYNPAEGTLRFLLEILNEEKRVLTKQAVLRNRRRRIFWKKPGNTEEENLQIGIQNIQTLFLERFPEFNQLFPKDKDGRIPKDKHKQAKDFIIKNIGTWEKFHEGVSYTAGSTSSPPYFKGSLDLILRSSFSSWGIDFDELSEEPKDAVLDQEEGLAHLGGFLERKYPFSHLRPFVLELSRQRTSPSGQMHFYISRLSSTGNSLRLSLTPKALFSSKIPEVLYINPQSEDKKGEKPYYWIDVLTDPDLSSISRVVSMRLQPDEPRKKIDSMRWRTIEEQLAVDFILGENGITYEHLRPFVFTLNARTPYCLGAHRELSLRIQHEPNIALGDKLIAVPRRDDQGLYYWLDIHNLSISEDTEISPIISSYRIIREEKKLISPGWINPERQLLMDYIANVNNVEFSNLRSFNIKLPEKSNQVYLGVIDGKPILINISSARKDGSSEVVIIPKRDPKGNYEWLEVFGIDSDTDLFFDKHFLSARIIRGEGILSRGWGGPGQQSLIDYLNGEKDFEQLLPINIQIAESTRVLNVSSTEERRLYLTLSAHFNLSKGEEVELIPIQEVEEGIIYELISNNCVLGRYKLDRDSEKFIMITSLDKQIDKDTRVFVDEEGKRWSNIAYFSSLLNLPESTISLRLKASRLPLQEGFAPRGNRVILFPEEEVLEILREYKKFRAKELSSEEAEDFFRNLEGD